LSVPIGSWRDTSFRVFFSERKCIRISFSIQRAAKVAKFCFPVMIYLMLYSNFQLA
jgi:hypothetical protein